MKLPQNNNRVASRTFALYLGSNMINYDEDKIHTGNDSFVSVYLAYGFQKFLRISHRQKKYYLCVSLTD